MIEYQLVPAESDDQVWLEQLRRKVYRDLFFATWGNWDESRHLRHCAECWERGEIHIIEAYEARVGMIQCSDHGDAIEVCEIQIDPAHQSRGLGTRLLLDTLGRAHAQSKAVRLSTGLKNHRAFELYLRLGFRHVEDSATHHFLEYPPDLTRQVRM